MDGATVELVKICVRIILSATFLLISQTKGLSALITVCNRHFRQVEDESISLRSKRLLNELSNDLGSRFERLVEEGLKLPSLCGLLMTNLINIEMCEPIFMSIDQVRCDCISMFITRIEAQSQFTPPQNPYKGLLRYHLVLQGDPGAFTTRTANGTSHSMSTGNSLISESDSVEISNPTGTELVILTLEIAKPYEGFDEMINVVAIQCIATHQDTQQRCTEYLKLNQGAI